MSIFRTPTERYAPLFSPEGGGQPAPQETPSASAPTDPSPAPSEGSDAAGEPNPFEGLARDFDDEAVTVQASDDTAAAPVAAPSEPSQPAAKAPAEPAPVVQPAAQTPPAPQEPQAATQPASSPMEPGSLVEQLSEHRDALIAGIAERRFQLSKEEAETLETNPAVAVPRLLSRVYYEATQSALLHIANYVPQMVQSQMRAMQQQKEAEEAFFSRFKALDRTKHAPDIMAMALGLRRANPNISRDDLFAMVGAAVMAKHGIANQPVAAAPNGAAPQPMAQPAPFVPARPGVSVRTTPEPENPWMGLAKDWEDS